SFSLFLYLFWGKNYLKSMRALKLKSSELSDAALNMEILEEGIVYSRMNSEQKIKKAWTEIKKVVRRKEFTYLVFTDNTYIFLTNETKTEEFIAQIKERIKPFESKISKNLMWTSFIPFLGLIFGFVFFLRGLTERNSKYII